MHIQENDTQRSLSTVSEPSEMRTPHKQYLIEKIEKVQKRATKLVSAFFTCKKLSYEQRLIYLKWPTLVYRI